MNIDSLMNAISTTACHAGEGVGTDGPYREHHRRERCGRGQPGTNSGPKQSIGCEGLQPNDDTTWSGACGMVHGMGCSMRRTGIGWRKQMPCTRRTRELGRSTGTPLQLSPAALQGKPGTAPTLHWSPNGSLFDDFHHFHEITSNNLECNKTFRRLRDLSARNE